MSYIFKEKIKYEQYSNFLKQQKFLSFMQEEIWAKAKNIDNHKVVAVLENDEVCALAHIIIKKEKNKKKFFIPNGYLLDFNNKELLEFMTKCIKKLAHMYGAYVVDIYPNMDIDDPLYSKIHTNLLNLEYKYTDEYFDRTTNILIPMKKKNKKISKAELKRKYENNEFYLKRGIEFEITNDKEDIKRLEYLVNNDYFDFDLIGGLITNFQDRIHMIFAKLDLVYYKHFLEENTDNTKELNKIKELLTISDTIDIGCALIIEPFNSNDSICEFLYNTEKESFENLDITNGLIYEVMKICNKNNYSYIKISNIGLNTSKLIERYNGFEMNYVGKYSLIINKITYFFNKPLGYKKSRKRKDHQR